MCICINQWTTVLKPKGFHTIQVSNYRPSFGSGWQFVSCLLCWQHFVQEKHWYYCCYQTQLYLTIIERCIHLHDYLDLCEYMCEYIRVLERNQDERKVHDDFCVNVIEQNFQKEKETYKFNWWKQQLLIWNTYNSYYSKVHEALHTAVLFIWLFTKSVLKVSLLICSE